MRGTVYLAKPWNDDAAPPALLRKAIRGGNTRAHLDPVCHHLGKTDDAFDAVVAVAAVWNEHNPTEAVVSVPVRSNRAATTVRLPICQTCSARAPALTAPTEWRRYASCRFDHVDDLVDVFDPPPDWFANPKSPDPCQAAAAQNAIAICRTICPVRAECEEYARAARPEIGIWGGTARADWRRRPERKAAAE